MTEPLPAPGPLSMELAASAGAAVIAILDESRPRMQAEVTNSIRDYAFGELFGVGSPDAQIDTSVNATPVIPVAPVMPVTSITPPPIIIHLPSSAPTTTIPPEIITGPERSQASARSRAIRSALAGLAFALVPALWGVLSTIDVLPNSKAAWAALSLVLLQTAWSTVSAYVGRISKTPPYDKPLDVPTPTTVSTPPVVLFPSDTGFNMDGTNIGVAA